MQNILLLHGALGSATQFNGILPALSKQFKVYTFNFSGHTNKPMPAKLSIAHFAAETAEFIETRIGGPVTVFGHSMGGYVGLYMCRYAMAPVARVMTLGTKLDWTPELAANEAKMLNTGKMKEKVPAFANMLAATHGENWEMLCAKTAEMMLEMGANPPLVSDDFLHIEQPVQLSLGDRDKLVSLEETMAAYRRLKNGRLLVLPNTQHPYEKASTERVIYEISGFTGS